MEEPPVIGHLPTGKLPAQDDRTMKSRLFVMLDNRWVVLGAIFFAMMFLGLPLLWRCPAFSRLEKYIWTIVILAYSALIFWLFYLAMSWSYHRVLESL